MLYQIAHQTTYNYSDRVHLKPHLLRLKPRCDRFTKLHNFSLTVSPLPAGSSQTLDLDGNNFIKLWFALPTQQLSIQTLAKVETTCTNPFDYMLEPWAVSFPFDFPNSLLRQLKPYLQPHGAIVDSRVYALAQELLVTTKGNTLDFLFALNQYIYQNCKYIVRETGEPFPPGITLGELRGSCRDYAVLFMEICRAMGIPARFVSGYQEGDAEQQSRDLHAWVEVYLPGAGWRGYDPTLGLIVCDRHIPLAASAISSYTSPVQGTVTPVEFNAKIASQLHAQIAITVL